MTCTIAYQYVKFYQSQRFFSYSLFLLLTGLTFSVTITVTVNLHFSVTIKVAVDLVVLLF